jgi:thiamine pyrophosphokinase
LGAIIFANGELRHPKVILDMIRSTDLLIAVNGGAAHCRDLGLSPSVIIGDLDSLEEELISNYIAQGADVFQHPTRKNETDLELAILYAVERDLDEIIIFGASGARWDMTLANVLLLAHPRASNLMIKISDGRQNIYIVRDGETLEIDGNPGDTVSLIPLKGKVEGVTTTNLEYSLENSTLNFASTRGISNVLLDSQASVHITKGMLLTIVNHN